jgi:hypothetical protein
MATPPLMAGIFFEMNRMQSKTFCDLQAGNNKKNKLCLVYRIVGSSFIAAKRVDIQHYMPFRHLASYEAYSIESPKISTEINFHCLFCQQLSKVNLVSPILIS